MCFEEYEKIVDIYNSNDSTLFLSRGRAKTARHIFKVSSFTFCEPTGIYRSVGAVISAFPRHFWPRTTSKKKGFTRAKKILITHNVECFFLYKSSCSKSDFYCRIPEKDVLLEKKKIVFHDNNFCAKKFQLKVLSNFDRFPLISF